MRISGKLWLVMLSVLLSCICFSSVQAAGLPIELEKKGAYICWFEYVDGSGSQKVTQPVRIQGDKAELDNVELVASDAKNVVLNVMDRGTGNVAVVPVKDAKPVKVKQDDFENVGSVNLRIVAEDGSPVESARVRVMDGSGIEHIAALTPADQGVVHLHNVAAGQVNIKVETEGLKKTIDSDITLPLERDSLEFAADIRVSGDVNTVRASEAAVKPDSAGGKTDSQKTESKAHKQQGGSALNYLLGIILLAMIVAVIWAALKSKGVTAKDALQKMGVSVPEDQQSQQAQQSSSAIPPVDSNICPFCGQPKDAAGNCACSLSSVPQSPAQPAGQSLSPKLIGSQGVYAMQILELTETGVIGRDPACRYPLPNDSTVSRKHATIVVSGSQCTIRDECSSNGTFVNGEKITEQVLKPGDEVRIGETKFRFEA